MIPVAVENPTKLITVGLQTLIELFPHGFQIYACLVSSYLANPIEMLTNALGIPSYLATPDGMIPIAFESQLN